MDDFFKFKRMITPLIIQNLFWIGVVVTVLGGLVQIVVGLTGQPGGGQQVFGGLILLLVGPLLVRVYCEIFVVLFSINDTLTDIKNKMRDTIG